MILVAETISWGYPDLRRVQSQLSLPFPYVTLLEIL
jgi:hypothetical protein